MATKIKQPNSKLYGIGTAIPVTNKQKPKGEPLQVLQEKVELLSKLFFERNILDPIWTAKLYFRKTLFQGSPQSGQALGIELVSNSFFAPSALMDVRVRISGKENDFTYFTKKFIRFKCNSLGSFTLPVTTILLKNVYASGMVLSATVFDFSTGKLAYAEEVVV